MRAFVLGFIENHLALKTALARHFEMTASQTPSITFDSIGQRRFSVGPSDFLLLKVHTINFIIVVSCCVQWCAHMLPAG